MHFNCEEERYVMDIPDECPKCGGKLEVDNRYGEDNTIKAFLICTNNDCDYEEDFTEEFEKAAASYGLDEEEYNEEDE